MEDLRDESLDSLMVGYLAMNSVQLLVASLALTMVHQTVHYLVEKTEHRMAFH